MGLYRSEHPGVGHGSFAWSKHVLGTTLVSAWSAPRLGTTPLSVYLPLGSYPGYIIEKISHLCHTSWLAAPKA